MRSAVLSFISLLLVGSFAFAEGNKEDTKKPSPPPQEQCFFSQDIRAFRARDNRTVDVQAWTGAVYRLEVAFCWDLARARQIRFDSSYVCPGSDLYIVNPPGNGGFEERCWIQQIRRIN